MHFCKIKKLLIIILHILIENPKKRRKLPTIISEDEVEKLLNAPDQNNASGMRDKCILELLYSAGSKNFRIIKYKGQSNIT